MKVNDWHGAYRDGWQGEIVPEAFAHPAKYSRSLIRRIYQHAGLEGWIPVGSKVVDPFGGVALGALDAMYLGLNWCGVELEERFVRIGQQNIARWNARYSTLPGWGTGTLIQGDSRQLAALVSEAGGCVSSPPFTDFTHSDNGFHAPHQQAAHGRNENAPSVLADGYGTHPANLGNMSVKGHSFEEVMEEWRRNSTINAIAEDRNGGEPASAASAITAGSLPAECQPLSTDIKPPQPTPVRTAGPGRVESGPTVDYPGSQSENFANSLVDNAKNAEPPQGLSSITSTTRKKPAESGTTQERTSNSYALPATPISTGQRLDGKGARPCAPNWMGDFDACLASPPYADSVHDGNGIDPAKLTGNPAGKHSQAFSEGYASAVVSSPPFAGVVATQDPNWLTPGEQGKRIPSKSNMADYGTTPGQLGAMPTGGFNSAIASPPYENVCQPQHNASRPALIAHGTGLTRGVPCIAEYGQSPDNLGNATDFWAAARTIVEQVYTVLRPGAHAIWVLKAYVRDKRIVDFPDQWRQMCEACGFETLHVHRAWLVEDHGAQATLDGGVKRKRTERKSFFRRLSEAKAQAAKHWQDVSRTDRARHLWDAHRDLWAYYNRRMAEPIKAPEMPPPKPTRSRILSAAETGAWEEAGKPAVHIETRIDYEIVLCQVKPLDAASDSGQASACVSSPPFTDSNTCGPINLVRKWCVQNGRDPNAPSRLATSEDGYGTDPANLGNMKPGDFDSVLKPVNSNGKGDRQ